MDPDNGVGKPSQAGLSLLEDIDSSTRGFCAILSRDLIAQERSLSFTHGRPVESCSSLEQMYFGKRRASRISLELPNFVDDIVRSGNSRKRAVFKNWTDALFVNLDQGGWARPPFLLTRSLRWWYLVLQQSRMSSKCFLKLSWESKVMP